jgi:large repetitive protein
MAHYHFNLPRLLTVLRQLLVLAVVLLGVVPSAQAVYVNRFTTTTNGAIVFTGNSLGLDGSNTLGTPGNQGGMGAFSTTNSALTFGTFPAGTTNNWLLNGSTANLSYPAGSTVLYAELIWGGTTVGGQDVSLSINNSITFKTPLGTYTVAPAAATAQAVGTQNRYVRSANVTGLVQIGGLGTYEVNGVPSAYGTGPAHAAGWTLAVVFGNPTLPPRNLSVFVGAEPGGNPPTGVSGFCTNIAGPVKGRLLVSALEGDSALAGDAMNFGPNTASMVALSGPNNPVGNFFAGQINDNNGALTTFGTHGTRNHVPGTNTVAGRQGWDITNVDVSAALTNSQTSAVAQGTTVGDQYGLTALGIQIDVGAPKFPLTVKAANRTTTFVGDTVTYTVSLDNTTGTANATNVMFKDNIPPGMSFVAGSVTVNGVSQASFNPASGFNMGSINAGSVGTVSFQVLVNAIPAAPALAEYANKAQWTYDFISCAGFPTESGTVETNPNIIKAIRLAPNKTVSPTGLVSVGQVLNYSIVVPNTGEAPTTTVSLTDAIPAGTSYVPGSTTMNGLPVADVSGVMPFASGAPINALTRAPGVINGGESATIQFRVTVDPSPPAFITNVAQVDPDGTGPAAFASVSAVNTALLAPLVAKSFTPATISAGATSQITITLTNPNGAALIGAALSDTLPAGITLSATPAVSTTCPGGTAVGLPGGITLGLSNGTIPSSGSCTVTAQAVSTIAGSFTNQIPIGAVSSTNGGSNISAASAVLTVSLGPSVNKSFSPSTIAPGGTSQLTISLVNPTGVALTAAAITDNLPSGMVISSAPGATNTCGGSLVAAAGGTSVALSGAVIPAANICTVSVQVTAAAVGNYTNTLAVGALATSAGSNASAATADLNVAAPLISKSFNPNPVGVNTTTILTITLTNPTSTVITGAAFTDIFPTTPSAMTVNSTTTSNTCGGSFTNSTGGAIAVGNVGVRLTGGTIPAGGLCTVTVRVRATLGGNYVNTIPAGGLTTTNGGSSAAAATATLSVGLPGVVKAFGTIAAPINTMASGQVVPLVVQVNNPNASALAITTLTDVFPPGMTLANTSFTTSCTGATLTSNTGSALAIGNSGIRLNGGTIPANGNCNVSVNVTATTPGQYTNTIAEGQLVTATGNNAFPAQAIITLLERPTISKAFAASSISPTASTTLTLTLGNTNATTLTVAAFTDTFPITPGAMTVSSTSVTNTCGGSVTNNLGGALAVGSAGIRLTGGIIPGNGTCTIAVTVTATVQGNYSNTLVAGALTTGNAGSSPDPTTAVLNVSILAPTVSKSFLPLQVARGQVSRLTFTINNPNVSTALNGVALNDPLPQIPGPLLVALVPNVTTLGCGSPTISANPSSATVGISGGTIAAAGSCVIALDVVSNAAGAYTNISGSVSSSNGGTGNTATANLTVLFPPVVSKSFSVNPVAVGGVSGLTIAVSNPNPGAALTGVNINDLYPSGLVNTATPGTVVTCSAGGSASATGGAANGTSVGFSGATIAPGGFCSVTVNVTAATAGNYDNITGNVTSTNAGSGGTSMARLVVGLRVSGRVFNDNGVGGGVANDGIINGAELGIAGSTVTLTNCASTVYWSATTDGAGNYALVIPSSATPGTALCVVQTNLSNYLSTGVSLGGTAPSGSYVRATDTITFTYTANAAPGNVNFGDVAPNIFTTDGALTTTAGSSVTYAHTFTAATAGALSFAMVGVPNPVIAGWSEVLHRDTNCNGQLDAGEPVISAPINVVAGNQICVIVKEFVPAGASNGSQNVVTITATLQFSNATPTLSASYQHTDTTTVGQTGLSLLKAVDKPVALPGEMLIYLVTYRNDSAGPITSVVINDSTPAFTRFQAASCGANPPGITACTVTSAPALNGSGSIVWTLTGSLQPGASSTVTFTVQVQP